MIKHSGEIVIWHKQLNTHEGWQDIVLKKLMDFFLSKANLEDAQWQEMKRIYFPGQFKVKLQLQNFTERQSPDFLSRSYFEHWIDLNCNIWRQLNTPVLLTLELQILIKKACSMKMNLFCSFSHCLPDCITEVWGRQLLLAFNWNYGFNANCAHFSPP